MENNSFANADRYAIVHDGLVLGVNEVDSTITVQVSPAEAERLARLQHPLVLGGEGIFDTPPWWRRFLRLRGFSGL
jgi:hypothetical protein